AGHQAEDRKRSQRHGNPRAHTRGFGAAWRDGAQWDAAVGFTRPQRGTSEPQAGGRCIIHSQSKRDGLLLARSQQENTALTVRRSTVRYIHVERQGWESL